MAKEKKVAVKESPIDYLDEYDPWLNKHVDGDPWLEITEGPGAIQKAVEKAA